MPEKFNFITTFNGSKLYVRRIPSPMPSKKVCIMFSSRSLCVESTMGIPMGSISYGDYIAQTGVETFLVDLRGYGMSSPIQEQLVETMEELTNPVTRQSFGSDVLSSVRYVRRLLGNDVEITLIGFSLLAPIIMTLSGKYPGEIQKIIMINPKGPATENESYKSFTEFLDYDDVKPYAIIDLNSIQSRLKSAQPPGEDFREPLWFEQAAEKLTEYHKSFNPDNKSWKVFKKIHQVKGNAPVGKVKTDADVLMISSQYDTENPLPIVERLRDMLEAKSSTLKILPDSTHLCIWEKARMTLYKWSADFIHELEPKE